jgi:hypothetical protein
MFSGARMSINAAVPDAGLIGSWSPGIGDPTVAGWATTFLHLATVVQTWRVMRRIDPVSFEWTVWRLLLVCMFALGINKQLDLQTAFTEVGWILAHKQGWYDDRQEVQKMFIAGLCGAAAAGCVAIAVAAYHMPPSTRLALCGIVFLTTFVLVRASSFHHVDILLNTRTIGLKVNWILENGGILLVTLAAGLRLARASASERAANAHLPDVPGVNSPSDSRTVQPLRPGA